MRLSKYRVRKKGFMTILFVSTICVRLVMTGIGEFHLIFKKIISTVDLPDSISVTSAANYHGNEILLLLRSTLTTSLWPELFAAWIAVP